MSEIPEHRIKRLQMRSMRRGIKEMDLILTSFASEKLAGMGEEDLVLYDQMLNENDHDLYQWVTAQTQEPEHYHGLISAIQLHLEG